MNLVLLRLLAASSILIGSASTAVAAKKERIELTKLGHYSSGIFNPDLGAAEIVTHDAKSQRLFVVNGNQSRVDVLDFADPAKPALLFSLDCATHGQPNSAAVHNGLIAVAVQAPNKTDPGKVLFFDSEGTLLNAVTVGALPDMITFTPNGRFVLTANEGEPNSYGRPDSVDPEGSVSIINVTGNLAKLKPTDVRTVSFAAFNGAVLDSSIRIAGPGATVAQDLEPEYIAVSHDSRTAYVTLQENNALAVVDIESATVTALKGLGSKDHAASKSSLETFVFDDAALPSIGRTDAGQELRLGGFSGLHFEGFDPTTGRLKFLTHTDRGPNAEPTGLLRPFLLPDFAPEIVRFELDRESGELAITQRIALQRAPGVPLSGRPNVQLGGGTANSPYNDEIGVDLFGRTLPFDPLGADLEGIVVAPDGTFWMCDEYRPALYQFSGDGVLLQRIVPLGTAAAAGQPAGTFGIEKLPAVLAQRRQNRGFEAIAWDNGRVYAFVQSPLRNPASLSNAALNAMQNIRIVEYHPATQTTRQFIYVMDNANLGTEPNTRSDKIGDAVSLGNGEFLVIERDHDAVPGDDAAVIEKKIYRFNLTGATDVSALNGMVGATGKTVDQLSIAEMLANNIRPVAKVLHVDLNVAGYDRVQKVEGLALIDPWTIAVINDNDFGVASITVDPATGTFVRNYTPEPEMLGLIEVLHQGLDASDSDNKVNIRPWPIRGMYQPDTIATFIAGDREYLIMANEGDAREWTGFNEQARVSSLTLDSTAFPLGAVLRHNANLGRLRVTNASGDTDRDGDFDELYAFGARSFSIRTPSGELVYDSGDAIEQIVAADAVFGAAFNANHNGSTHARDDRSDDKGPEPEAIAVGKIGSRTYAFVGLERIGGIVVFDVSTPVEPEFVGYFNSRDLTQAPLGLGVGGDLGPEGLLFIPASRSPVKKPLLVVANEVSGTVAVFQIHAVERD
jgi:hypothetical protein